MCKKIFIIAEAGVNHNGDLNLAHALVDQAADAGADAVKFQTFVAGMLVTPAANQAPYQAINLGHQDSQLSMLSKLELNEIAHQELLKHCQDRNIQFMSTAFDDPSIDLLVRLGCNVWKIPSGELTNLPYLRRIGGFGQSVILSTGMATLGEVESALSVLEVAGTPKANITLLHCTTEYPAPINEVNLKAMVTMGQAFRIRFGYSDHTQGIEIPVAAAALGASMIEKHFTLDRNMPGPDHRASLEPPELVAMVRAVRNVTLALGNGIKAPSPSEAKNRTAARKSIVASRRIFAGEAFGPDNLTTKRPGSGLDPMRWDEFMGKRSPRDYAEDDFIEGNL